MLGLPARYFLSHPLQAIATIASDPVEIWTILQQNYVAQHERLVPADLYHVDDDWERRMHELLGVPPACSSASEFVVLWPKVIAELENRGIELVRKLCKVGTMGTQD